MSLLEASFVSQLEQFKPSLAFFDIDGTLLNEKGHYSQELKKQLERLSALDVKLAIASGRPAIAAQFLFDELPLNDAGLFCTGAELYDPSKDAYLYSHYLDWDDLCLFEEKIKFYKLYCEYYSNDFYTLGNDEDIASVHSQHLRVSPRKLSFEELFESKTPITKLVLGVNWQDQNGLLQSISSEFSQFEFAYAYFLPRPKWLFASVISAKANKNVGFKHLLNYHNVNAENVIAFGDSHSDIDFIKQAGLGIAMGNAKDNIKLLADNVTLSSNEDGVALALKELLK